MPNQNPEQIARDKIDTALVRCGWTIQNKARINLQASVGVAVREYQTDIGPADYVLFVEGKPCGIIEAKRKEEGVHLVSDVENQSSKYANANLRKIKHDPLPYVYESTGDVTRFTDFNDPKPQSREVFSFHRPETFREWSKKYLPTGKLGKSLRGRFSDLPELHTDGLRDCQINAITNLENSFRKNQPKALIQMATGSGKTFTAITSIYRLLKFSKAKRILFLVDTKNLGEQAEQEFLNYIPVDDNRKFTELYNVQRLKSSYVARFSNDKIQYWSSKYNYTQNKIEQEMIDLVPVIKKRGYLLKDEFILVSKWKSPRTFKHYCSNDSAYIKEISGLALSTKNEQLRIESLTLLKGVSYPAASVFLHFFHKEKYPIIDFRALWSLKTDVPKSYTFPFWFDYVQFCRNLSAKSGLEMRALDKALWAYSKKNQKK